MTEIQPITTNTNQTLSLYVKENNNNDNNKVSYEVIQSIEDMNLPLPFKIWVYRHLKSRKVEVMFVSSTIFFALLTFVFWFLKDYSDIHFVSKLHYLFSNMFVANAIFDLIYYILMGSIIAYAKATVDFKNEINDDHFDAVIYKLKISQESTDTWHFSKIHYKRIISILFGNAININNTSIGVLCDNFISAKCVLNHDGVNYTVSKIASNENCDQFTIFFDKPVPASLFLYYFTKKTQ